MESILSRHAKVKLTDNLAAIPLDNGYKLIFNKNFGLPLILSNDLVNFLDNIRDKTIKLDIIDDHIFRMFINAKILVSQEISLDESLAKCIRNMRGKEDFLLIFVPSYFCNFKCDYCLIYQKGKQCKDIISNNLIKKIPLAVEQLMHHSPIYPFKSINVKLLGGEPTLNTNWRKIILLLNTLSKNFDLRNNKLITNGTLLSRDKVREFISLGGKEIQLSFDVRGDIRGKNSPKNRENVEDIMKVVTMCIEDGACVVLDLKINNKTLSNPNVYKLCDYINNQGLDGQLKIDFSRIISIDEYDPIINCSCIPDSAYYDIKKFDLFNITKFIQAKLPQSTKLNRKMQIQVFPCKPANLSSLLVYPNGDLSLCGKLYASLNPPLVGSLKSNPILLENEIKRYIHSVDLFSECTTCEIALLCGGKCVFAEKSKCSSTTKDKQIHMIKLIAESIRAYPEAHRNLMRIDM